MPNSPPSQRSNAGEGAAAFFIYRKQRRIEEDRMKSLQIMADKETERKEFLAKQELLKAEDLAKASRRKAKRRKKKTTKSNE